MSTMYKHWTELIKPRQLEVEEKTLTPTYGKFYAEPFERGFGQTIGNSLRRILLSSLMGASIVAVRIKGILHEFSTVPGVTEDVADIILNLKEIRLRLNESEQQTLKIDTKGPGTVYAKDIIAPPAVEIWRRTSTSIASGHPPSGAASSRPPLFRTSSPEPWLLASFISAHAGSVSCAAKRSSRTVSAWLIRRSPRRA